MEYHAFDYSMYESVRRVSVSILRFSCAQKKKTKKNTKRWITNFEQNQNKNANVYKLFWFVWKIPWALINLYFDERQMNQKKPDDRIVRRHFFCTTTKPFPISIRIRLGVSLFCVFFFCVVVLFNMRDNVFHHIRILTDFILLEQTNPI